MIKIGDKILTWFSDSPDKMSTVINIKPYTGRYPEAFNVVLVLSAPRTNAGTIEMVYRQP